MYKILKDKRKRFLSLFLIAVLAALSVCTLSACNLFNNRLAVNSVTVTVSGADKDADGVYVAELGETVTLTAEWDNKKVKIPSIQWYEVKSAENTSAIENQTNLTLDLKFEAYSEQTSEYCVSVNGVASSSVKIRTAYANVSAPTILADGYEIVQNVLQFNVTGAVADSITLRAEWNDRYLAPGTQCAVKWYFGNSDVAAGEGNSYVYRVPEIVSPTTVEIACRLYYNADEYTFAKLKIEYVLKYKPVNEVSLTVASGAAASDGIYFQAFAGNAQPVSVSASVLPLAGTNLSAECVWTVRNAEGVTVLTQRGRSVTFTPVRGKNVVSAAVDNVPSAALTVYVLPSSEFAQLENALTSTYIWDGQIQDRVLVDDYDFRCFLSYMVSLHKTGASALQTAFIYRPEWRNHDAVQQLLDRSLSNADESGKFSVYFSIVNGWLSIYFNSAGTCFGEPQRPYESSYSVLQAKLNDHLDEVSQKRTELPLDEVERTMTVETSNELYRAVEWGYRPVFADTEKGRATGALYEKARDVLKKYVGSDMNDYEKVLRIYEWIVRDVKYDYGVVKVQGDVQDKINYNAYYLEGVFNDGVAVCDGKSKAFVLLCGIEGIRSLRITGSVTTVTDAGHAWNKVLVDVDGDGVREWYVVDTTWGDLASGDRYVTEYMSYSYFLTGDEFISETHVSSTPQPAAQTAYNCYNDIYAESDGLSESLYVTSKEQLKKLLQISLKKNVGVEVKLSQEFMSANSIRNLNELGALVRQLNLQLGNFENATVLSLDNSMPIFVIYAKAQ